MRQLKILKAVLSGRQRNRPAKVVVTPGESAIQALSNAAYQCLKLLLMEIFDDYLTLVELCTLFDVKNKYERLMRWKRFMGGEQKLFVNYISSIIL